MYRLWLLNFGWFLSQEFTSLDDAKRYAQGVGYEVIFYQGSEPVASWSIIGGFRAL